MRKHARYLITGGTGCLGRALIKRLVSQGFTNLVVVARNEGNLIALREEYPTVEIITGDISDSWVVVKAMKNVAGVFHAAAFKHVGMAEEQSFQCIQSNVVGSMKLLAESFLTVPDFVLGISTDKVAQVSGIYGATKLCMEALFREAHYMNPGTKYRTVRYGNIIKSTGSFLTKWEDKMKRGEAIFITDPDMTRFFWSVDEAVDAIFDCLLNAPDASPWISRMKGIRLGEALKACQKVWGSASPVHTIGRQPGENMHETIDGKVYSNEVEQFTVEEFAALL
jgi:FlaA1/EpsC-like NDP-sugar epimerase